MAEIPDDRDSAPLDVGRAVCGDANAAETREWLVTNGLGGYASGTVAGVLTRRYHGLLVAALRPPLGRTLLLTAFDETARYAGRSFELAVARWAGDVVAPDGARYLERFRLEGSVPVWSFALAGALLEKCVWMEHGANATYVRYTLVRATRPLELEVKALVNYRDFHGNTHAGAQGFGVEALADGVIVRAFNGAEPFAVRAERGSVVPASEWYRHYELARERERGLDDIDDNFHAATFTCRLSRGESVTFAASTGMEASLDGAAALERRRGHDRATLVAGNGAATAPQPKWWPKLLLAAAQFIVRRDRAPGETGHSVIAGYHWFGDWGRDTMIALPGLTLATGRHEIARSILATFAPFVDRGMLPNIVPAEGESSEYNTVDAALWYIEAVRCYVDASEDREFLRSTYDVLVSIVANYRSGTRYGIHEDAADGLIAAGEPGVQLTWMDAKVGNDVITPRIGKPVEVAALWLNALASLQHFASLLGDATASARYEAQVAHTRAGFARFWNPATGTLFDVLDGPAGNDAALRPNALFALSLRETALAPERARAVVDTCARELLTTYGLRSLAPGDARYRGRYGGDQTARDAAYHQGTVWSWLIGPFALAYARAYDDRATALQFVDTLARQLDAYGLGTLPEIAEGDAPHAPRGCIAQAWSVAEVLRAFHILSGRTQGA